MDVVISIGGAVDSVSPSHYHQYHNHDKSSDSIYNIDRILQLKAAAGMTDPIVDAAGMTDPSDFWSRIDRGRLEPRWWGPGKQ